MAGDLSCNQDCSKAYPYLSLYTSVLLLDIKLVVNYLELPLHVTIEFGGAAPQEAIDTVYNLILKI